MSEYPGVVVRCACPDPHAGLQVFTCSGYDLVHRPTKANADRQRVLPGSRSSSDDFMKYNFSGNPAHRNKQMDRQTSTTRQIGLRTSVSKVSK